MTPSYDAPIRTSADAAAYLEGLINVEKKPGIAYERLGLQPVRALLERLGNPEREFTRLIPPLGVRPNCESSARVLFNRAPSTRSRGR